MKKQNLWVIKDPKGRFVWDTITIYRSTCISALECGLGVDPFHAEDETRDVYWKRLYRKGYRVEKIVAVTYYRDGVGETFEGTEDQS